MSIHMILIEFKFGMICIFLIHSVTQRCLMALTVNFKDIDIMHVAMTWGEIL